MVPNRVLAGFACAAFVALGTAARAEEYRAGEFLGLDLSKAVLSPKRLGPPAEFAPVAVEARTDAKQAVVEPKAEHRHMVRTKRVIASREDESRATAAHATATHATTAHAAKPRGAARV